MTDISNLSLDRDVIRTNLLEPIAKLLEAVPPPEAEGMDDA